MTGTSIRGQVLGEICRICDRNGTCRFTRGQLMKRPVIDLMIAATRSKEKHPHVTVAYELSNLAKQGDVRNIGRGRYELTPQVIPFFAAWKQFKRSLQRGQGS